MNRIAYALAYYLLKYYWWRKHNLPGAWAVLTGKAIAEYK